MTDDNPLKIPFKVLAKLRKTIKLKPFISLAIVDLIDVYNLKKTSPNVEDERLYRVCLCSLPNDKFVNKFALKLRGYDISTGIQRLSVKEVPLSKMKKWKDYKAIQPHFKDYKPYEEVQSINIKKLMEYCNVNNINEEKLWHLLLDDTYSKSEELLKLFYPTIIPLPRFRTDLQKYNSHCLLFTQAKTGKSETCYRLYPKESFEDISIASLLGTVTKNERRVGFLDGQGLFFVDEINKLSHMRSSMGEENSKILDFCNNFLEKGIERRGLWGQEIEVKGTKTLVFSGNVNIMNAGEKDFYHLMSKICNFSSDSDKFGRRFGFFVYSKELNLVDDKKEVNSEIIEIINALRKEVIADTAIQKKILKVIDERIDWVNEKDEPHKKKILSYIDKLNSNAVKAFIKGMAMSSHKKLKFMALRITIANHLFYILKKGDKRFFNLYQSEMEDEYEHLKELLCYKQIENLTRKDKSNLLTAKDKIRKYIKENNLNLDDKITEQAKMDMSINLRISIKTVKNELTLLRKDNTQGEEDGDKKHTD